LRGFDNYQKNTGERHPIQPEADSTGSKRAVGKDALTDDSEQLWQGLHIILCDVLCLKQCFDRRYFGWDTRGEWSVFLSQAARSNLVLRRAEILYCRF
jgi:hypothetical protein